MTNKRVVHKVKKYLNSTTNLLTGQKVFLDALNYCGEFSGKKHIDDVYGRNTAHHWQPVTCKKCLKKRGEKK